MLNVEMLQMPATVIQHWRGNATVAAEALALAVAAKLQSGVRRHGTASLLLSGGRTPALFQQRLSAQPLDWSSIALSLTDDRWLPADHADSNEKLLRENLLRGPAAAARFIPLVDSMIKPEQHLASAERAIQQMQWPIDAVVLGVGEDGHTASLFADAPETAAAINLHNPNRLAAIHPATAPYPRISMTLQALLQTRVIFILAHGEPKRAALEAACRPGTTPLALSYILRQRNVPVHLYYSL